ncbi:hypothetical protein OFO10_05215 [Campylobacter sp. VBCF_06 NA8]|uniref:hypothetical protein n=1 Tax=Campylobacter sp. VBCF_06 NA8 TaxID=2983822 RepID=UPI0022E9B9FD|nr:hypothetical protein [Campylobacter sp. VBCF_06 NA8]MDA3046552.1 hypothetical protein [Campylobacter sp. VBCF_06 NA8]
MKTKTIFMALSILSFNAFAAEDNPLDAKVVFYYDGKIANDKVEYKARIVQTNNKELNKKLEQDFCHHSLSYVREDQVEECLKKKDIHQAIKDDIADITKEFAQNPKFTYGVRDYEQEFAYLGDKKYLKICHSDNAMQGTMNLHFCDLYDIKDPKNPIFLKDTYISDFFNDEQREKTKFYFARYGEQFGIKKEISAPCEQALQNGGIYKYEVQREKDSFRNIITWDKNITAVCQSEAEKKLLENLEPNARGMMHIEDVEVSKTDDGKYDISLTYQGYYGKFWYDFVYVDEKTLKELVPKEFLE